MNTLYAGTQLVAMAPALSYPVNLFRSSSVELPKIHLYSIPLSIISRVGVKRVHVGRDHLVRTERRLAIQMKIY